MAFASLSRLAAALLILIVHHFPEHHLHDIHELTSITSFLSLRCVCNFSSWRRWESSGLRY